MRLSSAVQVRSQAPREGPRATATAGQAQARSDGSATPPATEGGHGQCAGDTKTGLQSQNKVRETVGKP